MEGRLWFWSIGVIHAGVACAYRCLAGVSVDDGRGLGEWDRFWQTLPAETLRTDLVRSVWNLHSQPPLHNLYGSFFVRWFGDDALSWMHVSNIVLGSLVASMAFVICRRFLRSAVVAGATTLFVALHPGLFLYEAYVLYTLPTTFLLTASTYCLCRFDESRRTPWLAGFVLALNLVILVRSAYHPVILLLAIPLTCVLNPERWARTLLIGVAISVLSVGWYAKNYAKFGVVAGSSWGGQNLFKIASRKYKTPELEAMAADGLIDAVVAEVPAWSLPTAYEPHGFRRRSDVPSLARNDYHNINEIDISRTYGANAIVLIRHRPGRYVSVVQQAFRTFCRPASHNIGNVDKENVARMQTLVDVHAGILQGGLAARWLRDRWGGKGDFGAFLMILLPVALGLFVWRWLSACGLRVRSWIGYSRRHAPIVFGFVVISYTAIVASTLDYGENNRFKVPIEPTLWPFVVALLTGYGFRPAPAHS